MCWTERMWVNSGVTKLKINNFPASSPHYLIILPTTCPCPQFFIILPAISPLTTQCVCTDIFASLCLLSQHFGFVHYIYTHEKARKNSNVKSNIKNQWGFSTGVPLLLDNWPWKLCTKVASGPSKCLSCSFSSCSSNSVLQSCFLSCPGHCQLCLYQRTCATLQKGWHIRCYDEALRSLLPKKSCCPWGCSTLPPGYFLGWSRSTCRCRRWPSAGPDFPTSWSQSSQPAHQG